MTSSILAVLFLLNLVQTQGQGQSGKTKLEQLLDLQGENDFVHLTPELFNNFVQGQSRNYLIVVYFSTFTHESQCEGCRVLNPIFSRVAYSYKASGGNLALSTEEEKLKPVIFSVMEYSQEALEIIKKFKFSSLPNIFVSSKSFGDEGYYYNIDKSKVLSYKEGTDYNDEKILMFLNEKTGRKVQIKVKVSDLLKFVLFCLSLACLIFAILRSVVYNLFNPKCWWVSAMMVYVVCMAGIVYDVVHVVELGYIDQETGEFGLWAQGPKEQYVIEGFLMAGVIALSGVGLIVVNLAASIEGRWVVRVVGLMGIALWVTCGYYIDFVYKNKSDWYRPTFGPPDGYIRGGLMMDQGNSF